MVGRKQAFGMALAGILKEVRNPGHPSCSLPSGRWGPSPHPACFAPHPPCARLSLGLSCFTAYLSFHSQASPAGGSIGEEAPAGSTEQPEVGRRGMGAYTLAQRCVVRLPGCSRVSPLETEPQHTCQKRTGLPCCGLEAGNETGYTRTGAQLGVGTQASNPS